MKKKILSITAICLTLVILTVVGLGFVITPVMKAPKNDIPDGVKPFSSEDGVMSNYYRIPSVITTEDGTLVASIDARFGGTHDSANNLDTAVSISTDNGKTWSKSTLALYFDDWDNSKTILKQNGKLTTKDSASFIDPSMVQDKNTGRIFMFVDAYPYATGATNSVKGSGFTEIDGQKYLMLCKDGEKDFNYTVRENGAIYDKNGEKTEYSLNDKYEILQNGKPLTVKQKKQRFWYNISFGTKTDKEIAMNIMYKDALFKPLKTSYIYMTYSDDNGKTWANPVNLNAQIKPNDEAFMGVCPGRAIQIQNGKYAGRLLFTAYYLDNETGVQKFTCVFSDDNGVTWNVGQSVELTEEVPNISETQIIELPNGNLQSYSRTTAGYVATATSTDGGNVWSDLQLVKELPLTTGSGCQVSAINYNGKTDGSDAVILSAPAGESRTNGFVYVGLIKENTDSTSGYEIEWTYKKEITDKNTNFAYSCLTQMQNGEIGLLYEQANQPQTVDTVVFKSYTTDELCETKIEK